MKCENVCVCGWTSTEIFSGDRGLKYFIKTHSDSPMVFQNPPTQEFLNRMEYNVQHDISVKAELWDTDNSFNPITLIKTLSPDCLMEV